MLTKKVFLNAFFFTKKIREALITQKDKGSFVLQSKMA